MEVTLQSIAPNASIDKWYRDQLYALIKDMRQSVIQEIITPYKSELAMDGIMDWIGHIMDSIVSKWQNNLDSLSDDISRAFVSRSQTHYDKRLQNMLKKRGFAVGFTNSKYVNDQAKIAIGENVSLIKSVSSQYLDNVRAAVWRSVKGGYDLESLIKQLSEIDGVSERRAKLIARDQTVKANQAFEDARSAELGITEATWLHSHAGKTWRPSHVKANGTRYTIAEGLYLDGKWTKPGEEINCRCRKHLIIEIPDQMVNK